MFVSSGCGEVARGNYIFFCVINFCKIVSLTLSKILLFIKSVFLCCPHANQIPERSYFTEKCTILLLISAKVQSNFLPTNMSEKRDIKRKKKKDNYTLSNDFNIVWNYLGSLN